MEINEGASQNFDFHPFATVLYDRGRTCMSYCQFQRHVLLFQVFSDEDICILFKQKIACTYVFLSDDDTATNSYICAPLRDVFTRKNARLSVKKIIKLYKYLVSKT